MLLKSLAVCFLGTIASADWTFSPVDYFQQNADSSLVTTDLDNFGLDSSYTWDSLLAELEEKSVDGTYYKLLFIQRHGEAWHNVVKDSVSDDEWDQIGIYNTYGNITLFDDDLTPTGVSQIESLSQKWQALIANGAPYPESHYTSPLQRTLHTHELTWGAGQTAEVVENLRERYGVYTPYERHSKSWIASNYPIVTFEHGFTEADELWQADVREKKKHVTQRCVEFLNYLFSTDDSLTVSLTTHSKTITKLLGVIGIDNVDLEPGQMYPVVVKATGGEVSFSVESQQSSSESLSESISASSSQSSSSSESVSTSVTSVESSSSVCLAFKSSSTTTSSVEPSSTTSIESNIVSPAASSTASLTSNEQTTDSYSTSDSTTSSSVCKAFKSSSSTMTSDFTSSSLSTASQSSNEVNGTSVFTSSPSPSLSSTFEESPTTADSASLIRPSTVSEESPYFTGYLVDGEPHFELHLPGNLGPWSSLEFTGSNGNTSYTISQFIVTVDDARLEVEGSITENTFAVKLDGSIEQNQELVASITGHATGRAPYSQHLQVSITSEVRNRFFKREVTVLEFDFSIEENALSSSTSTLSSESAPQSSLSVVSSSVSDASPFTTTENFLVTETKLNNVTLTSTVPCTTVTSVDASGETKTLIISGTATSNVIITTTTEEGLVKTLTTTVPCTTSGGSEKSKDSDETSGFEVYETTSTTSVSGSQASAGASDVTKPGKTTKVTVAESLYDSKTSSGQTTKTTEDQAVGTTADNYPSSAVSTSAIVGSSISTVPSAFEGAAVSQTANGSVLISFVLAIASLL